MGNGSSSRRNNGRIQHSPLGYHGPPRMTAPHPPGYPPSLPPNSGPPMYVPNNPFFYTQNYNQGPLGPYSYNMPSNGQYMMNYQQQFRNPPTPASNPASVAESQKANTIRNDVNIKKSTLRLEKDEGNSGFHLVAFTFDATLPGCFSIFFLAHERGDCSYSPVKPNIYGFTRVSFQKGSTQTFKQESGSGVNLLMFDERDLTKAGEGDVYTLIVRAETVGKNPPADFSINDTLPDGEHFPKYVHCQTTQAVLEKKDNGEYKVKVVRQNIWIDGARYELQEIFGIENSGGPADFDGSDSGKECVICMSEPRDTTVLPCRHMCMCSECAKVLKYQTNRCPICRTPVEKLLEIKVPRIEDVPDQNGSNEAQVSGSGQSSATYPSVGQSSGDSGESGIPPDDAARNSLALIRHDNSGPP